MIRRQNDVISQKNLLTGFSATEIIKFGIIYSFIYFLTCHLLLMYLLFFCKVTDFSFIIPLLNYWCQTHSIVTFYSLFSLPLWKISTTLAFFQSSGISPVLEFSKIIVSDSIVSIPYTSLVGWKRICDACHLKLLTVNINFPNTPIF